MALFSELKHELEHYLDSPQIEQIHKVFHFAAQAHKGQQRHSGDPYITHPLTVALVLAQMRMDPQTISAAILHDVIEDTPIDKDTLIAEFGTEVAELVDGVSKLTQIHFQSRAEAQAENFRKMLLAMAKDIRIILIKLADRLHNMRTIDVVPAEKRRRIALETLQIYAPIAGRLGMHAFRVEFEELCFAALYPTRARVLQEHVRKARRAHKRTISHLETQVKECLEKHNLPPSVVWGREKHIYSVYRNMREKRLSFAEIMDTYTICIVVDSLDTCYRALGAIHTLYKPIPEKFRDYIALPKANGYQALHTTLFGPHGIPIEIQIRTVDMDNMADNGIITHWRNYAQEAHSPAHLRAREWLKRLLEIQQTAENPLEFIENVKIDLFPDEVYVFTPQGHIMELPRGATPIDFAYAIHSDIGDHCSEARIDRRPAPLSTPLMNGQMVEVVTDSQKHPDPSWLDFVVTGKARSSIRYFLKSQHRIEAINLGNRLLKNALLTLGMRERDFSSINFKIVLKHFKYKAEDDLFEAIGLGEQMATPVAQRLLNKSQDGETTRTTSTTKEPLIIKGTEGMLVVYAKCCQPIPGDPIIGILNAGHGITVHVSTCPQVAKFEKHPEKHMPACWEENINATFKVDIRVETANQQGVLAQLINAITQTKTNIENIHVGERDSHYCAIHLTLSVHDRTHLARVMRRLRMLKTVIRLFRGK